MVFVVVVMVSVVAAAVVVFAVVVVAFLPQSRLSEGSRYEKQVIQLETYDLIG